MKRDPRNRAFFHNLLALALSAGLALPLPASAALVDLATSPLATSTTSTVKPNVLFVLDDSGSMSWTFMPDNARYFRGQVGYQSNQCNGVYYNPDITYSPPLDAVGDSYTAASFTAARDNGFDSSTTARNLNSEFIANRFSPESANSTYDNYGSYTNNSGADSLGPYAAQYYNYSGSQTVKDFDDSGSTFYTECDTDFGVIAGNASNLFTKISLSSSATATTATIVVSGSNSTSVSGIKVNGTQEIMSGTAAASSTSSTVATNIAAQINLCTSAQVGNCTTAGGHGYTASVSSSTVTITGLAATAETLVITKGNTGTMTLSPTIFPIADSAKLTNFANWYSFYRTRMQMMKTSAGQAFSSLNDSYRVGLMRINASTLALSLGTFESTQRTDWYTELYDSNPSGSTPLRRALSYAGNYYAGKMTGYLSGTSTDPIQYSCQQSFTILSSDGYWSTGTSYDGFKLDGADIGNQDGTALPPMHDGGQEADTVTTTYTRNDYAETGTKISGGSNCANNYRRITVLPQTQSCSVTGGVTACTSWVDGTKYYLSPYTSDSSSCVHKDSVSVPTPDPSTSVVVGTPVTTTGAVGGTENSLADVAMYYYQTDLRTTTLDNCTGSVSGEDVCTNNVFTSTTDNNVQQHMTTFTLGLGANGRMVYSSSYQNDTSGDFYDIKLEQTADASHCTWQTAGTACTWPDPGDGDLEKIDDMWHAAVNGRGAFFSASDPTSLSSGLSNALAGINSRKGSAAAAATSTLNPVAGNNYAFVASYTTVKWSGNLEARGINTDTGAVNENASWCVEDVVAGACSAPGTIVADTAGDTTSYYCVTPDSLTCPDGELDGTDCRVPVATSCTGTLKSLVTDDSDSRVIKTANSSGSGLVDFTYANLTADQQAYFGSDTIDALNQWSALSTAQRTAAAGTNLVNYLRGQSGFEQTASNPDNQLYRTREAVLGDALESQPAFIGPPVFSYPYPGYSAYKTAQASRSETVYMGVNDGMMHAFNADTGAERWAYVPSMAMPSLWKLADTSYATLHTNYVNGSPITSDICSANCSVEASAVWKTILVAGLNGGGRGYYALDITDPDAPALLWEFTTTTGLGAASGYDDDDVGYSFGKPIIARKSDGTWVVLLTSGYNNTSPGDGEGYLYVLNAASGAIISKIATDTGSTTTPSGLAQITAWNDESAGNQAGYVYGGDLLGNVWRFDINSTDSADIGTGSAIKFASLYSDDAGTSPQPVTVAPVLGKIVGERVIFIGTGKYLENDDLTSTQTQTIYAIKDDNTTATLVNPRTTLVEQTIIDNPDATASRVAGTGSTVNFYTGRGWYVDFPDSGERVNIDMKLVQGTLLVPTTVPSNTVCSPGGYGWLNFLDYKTGSAINTATDLVSIKYESTIVGVNVIYVGGEPKVGVVTSTNPTPELTDEVSFAATAAGFSGKRVIWRELIP